MNAFSLLLVGSRQSAPNTSIFFRFFVRADGYIDRRCKLTLSLTLSVCPTHDDMHSAISPRNEKFNYSIEQTMVGIRLQPSQGCMQKKKRHVVWLMSAWRHLIQSGYLFYFKITLCVFHCVFVHCSDISRISNMHIFLCQSPRLFHCFILAVSTYSASQPHKFLPNPCSSETKIESLRSESVRKFNFILIATSKCQTSDV